MPTTISPPTTLKFIQKEKNYVIGVKNQNAQNHQRECAQSVQANTGLNAHYAQNAWMCTRKASHFYERCIYGSCQPLNHFWSDPQHDLTLISERNLA
jgi:hypothetical protein